MRIKMTACVHGNVCRAWMKKIDSGVPLTPFCPICAYFEPVSDVSKWYPMADEYITRYDAENDRYIVERMH